MVIRSQDVTTGDPAAEAFLSDMVGAATVMREKAVPIGAAHEEVIIDTCGTGGDGSGTFNISTASALVAAAAGAKVAKHGNRAITSKCGSADVLEALGIPVDLTPEDLIQRLKARYGDGFTHDQAIYGVSHTTVFTFLAARSLTICAKPG